MIQAFVVIGGFGLAWWTFWKNTRIRRAEWLLKLYEKFYGDKEIRKTRRVLDYGGIERDRLLTNLTTEEDLESLESLIDYLNFFEFVGSLRKMRQVNLKGVRMMFEYYLRSLAKNREIMDYCREQGFENLQDLVEELKLTNA